MNGINRYNSLFYYSLRDTNELSIESVDYILLQLHTQLNNTKDLSEEEIKTIWQHMKKLEAYKNNKLKNLKQ